MDLLNSHGLVPKKRCELVYKDLMSTLSLIGYSIRLSIGHGVRLKHERAMHELTKTPIS